MDGWLHTWTHVIRKSIYFGAEHLIGFFTWFPSAQWYWIEREIFNYNSKVPSTVLVCDLQCSVAHLIFGSCTHHWARLLRTKLCDGSVQHVDLVEEVDCVHRNPPEKCCDVIWNSFFLYLTRWCLPPQATSQLTLDYLHNTHSHLIYKLDIQYGHSCYTGCFFLLVCPKNDQVSDP